MKLSISAGILSVLFFFCLHSHAQTAPDIQWQKTYGGKDDDELIDEAVAPDGGYTFLGYTKSHDSDFISNHGDFDFWFFHTDTAGNLLWKKLYGGSKADYAFSFVVTSDGGYILFGHTHSTDGDVSDSTNTHYGGKLWVIKTDVSGNIQWQKLVDFSDSSPSDVDGGKSGIIQTHDGGYLLTTETAGGFPYSKYYGFHDYNDILVIRLDQVGNELWRRCLGSSLFDHARTAIQTPDGGFFIMGDVSAGDGDVTDFIGFNWNYNLWQVKLSSSGDLSWTNCLTNNPEGVDDFFRRKNGSLLLASSVNWYPDIWIGITTDSQKIRASASYGGSGWDLSNDVMETPGGNFVTVGTTGSKNKDVSGNHGHDDAWVFETDSSLKLLWQKCLGGSAYDDGTEIKTGSDGGLLMCGFTESKDGDVTVNNGYRDGWVVKLKPDCPNSTKANFSFVQAGLSFSFTSLSQNANSYEWSFGDGSVSNEQNPSHTYSIDGLYEVILTTNNGCATDYHRELLSTCTTVTSFFTYQQLDAVTYQFNNVSQNATSWTWKFGDSTTDRTQNPVHTYKKPGIYYAALTAKNNCDSTGYFQLINSCGTLKEKWGFSSSDLTVSFHDSSKNATSWLWVFNDGDSSREQNPVHTFKKVGRYYINCTASSACESATFSQSITVCAGITSNFSFSNSGLDYSFINLSLNGKDYFWHFDSVATIHSYGIDSNLHYTFTSPGYHTVCLTVTNDCDTADYCFTFFASEIRHIHECWYRTFSDSSKSSSYKLIAAADSSGNVFIAAGNASSYYSKKLTLLKYDIDGNLIWSSVNHQKGIVPAKIILDRGGNIFIAGAGTKDSTSSRSEPLILKYDKKGKFIKQIFYDPDDQYGYPNNDMVIDNFGNIYVTGSSTLEFKENASVYKFDNDLNLMWQLTEKNSDVNLALHLAVDSERNIYMTAQKYDPNYDSYVQDIILFKYDSMGNKLWSFADVMDGQENGSQLILDRNEDPISSVNSINYDGDIFGGSSYSFLIKRNKKNGKLIFNKSEYKGFNGYDYQLGVAIDSANNYYWISGLGDVVKYDSDGNKIWEAIYRGSTADFASYSFNSNASGETFVTGSSMENWHLFIESFKMNADGNIVWAKTFDTGDPDEEATTSTLDSKDNFTAVGFTGDEDSSRLSTIAIRYCNECDALNEIHSVYGDTAICAGEENVPYFIDSIPEASNYSWSYSGAGVLIDAQANTAALNISSNATDGWLNVFAGNDCDSTLIVSKSIHILPAPEVILHLTQDTFCTGSSPFILAGGSPSGGNYFGNGVYNGIFYPDSAGVGAHEITYTYEDSNGCVNSDSQMLRVDVCSGIAMLANGMNVTVFPNPFMDQTIIQFSLSKNSTVEISLNDLSGRKIRTIAEGNFFEGNYQIELKKENLNAGIYLLQLKTAEGIITKKLIVQ